jgi:hypothetical protein
MFGWWGRRLAGPSNVSEMSEFFTASSSGTQPKSPLIYFCVCFDGKAAAALKARSGSANFLIFFRVFPFLNSFPFLFSEFIVFSKALKILLKF